MHRACFFLNALRQVTYYGSANRKSASASGHRNEKKKMVPFLSPLHFSTPATQPTGNIYLKIALKYVQTILPARQLLKADFMDTYGFVPVYMMSLKLACSFGLRSHNTSS